MGNEANLVAHYRQSRRDFIAAVTKAGSDAISRVHPAMGPDGKPLFCDSAAFGPRDGTRGLFLLADADGAATAFLTSGFVLPKGARLVAVHAPDPFAAAWGRTGAPADWPEKTLTDIAAEDLSRVKKPVVLDMAGSGTDAHQAIAAAIAAL
jgi:Protein of unknown function (DUF2817)